MSRSPRVALMLTVAYLACATSAAVTPRKPKPTIGDTLEINGPDDYLGKDWQAVSVMAPLSGNRRLISRKTGDFSGIRRRKGMVHWIKKREKAHPFERLQRKPWKVRYLKEDPVGVALSLAEEGKVCASLVSQTAYTPYSPLALFPSQSHRERACFPARHALVSWQARYH